MKLKKLIKQFTWSDDDRDVVTFGASTRINPDTHKAQLTADADGLFPLTANLFVKSRLTNPQQLRRWIGFEARVIHKLDDLGAPITSARFRLDNGTTEFYHNGASWVAAGVGDWNTEQQVADNIAAFDAIANLRQLRVVVNLATTDQKYTPQLDWVKVLYETAVEFQEDLIYRSLIPALKQFIRPISQVVVPMPVTGTTLNVSAFKLETGYNLVDIDAVFNFDLFDEGSRENFAPNLLLSFVAFTGVITLTGSIAANTKLWIRFTFEPEVAVTTSQDFIEAERLPAVILTGINLVSTMEAPSGDDSVANKGAGTAVVVPSPQQGDLEVTIVGITDKGVDQQRLQEQINAFFFNHPLLISVGIDERYRLHLISEYEAVGEPGQEENHVGRARFQIRNFKRWLRDAYDDFIVTSTPTLAFTNG